MRRLSLHIKNKSVRTAKRKWCSEPYVRSVRILFANFTRVVHIYISLFIRTYFTYDIILVCRYLRRYGDNITTYYYIIPPLLLYDKHNIQIHFIPWPTSRATTILIIIMIASVWSLGIYHFRTNSLRNFRLLFSERVFNTRARLFQFLSLRSCTVRTDCFSLARSLSRQLTAGHLTHIVIWNIFFCITTYTVTR